VLLDFTRRKIIGGSGSTQTFRSKLAYLNYSKKVTDGLFDSHRRGVLEILGIHETDKELATKSDVAAAILKWNAIDFEDTCAERGMCVTALRTYEEWKEHPQAIALRDVPPVEIRKVAESPPPATKKNAKRTKRPLQGINVLDLSRVLAGPVAGRTLAGEYFEDITKYDPSC